MQKQKLAILLATYNGAEYLRELLDSLFLQQEKGWDLIISDDCSKDNTPAILHEYAARYPERVFLLENNTSSGSSKNNFFRLMQSADGYDYLMFSDQDDVWKPDKVAYTLQAMKELESGDRDVPCCALEQLVIQNAITGCTMMINAALREKALLPADMGSIRMHDAWCGLWAAAVGRIGFLPEQTIYYRQHGMNVVGAKDVSSLRYLVGYLCRGQQNRQALADAERQAGAFLDAAGDALNEEQKQMLYDYSTLRQKKKIERIRVIAKYGIWKTGWRRCAGEIIQI